MNISKKIILPILFFVFLTTNIATAYFTYSNHQNFTANLQTNFLQQNITQKKEYPKKFTVITQEKEKINKPIAKDKIITVKTQITQENFIKPEIKPKKINYKPILPHKTRTPDKIRGIYLSARMLNSPFSAKILTNAKNSKINTIVIDVKENGILYDTKIPEAQKWQTIKYTIRDLRTKIKGLKQSGFYVIGRVAALRDTTLARKFPLKNIYGNPLDRRWTDGNNPKIIEYHQKIIDELADFGIDEIQLDYIRFPTNKFSLQTPKTLTERTAIINNFVQKMHETTQKHGIKLSIDTFGILAWDHKNDIKRLGQDLRTLIKYTDYISPMVYPSHFSDGFAGYRSPAHQPYQIIHDSTAKLTKIIGEQNKSKIRPWLQGFNYKTNNFGPKYIKKQIQALTDLDISAFLIWNPSNDYTASWPVTKNLD